MYTPELLGDWELPGNLGDRENIREKMREKVFQKICH